MEAKEEMFNLVSGWALVVMETQQCHPVLLEAGAARSFHKSFLS